MGNHCDLKYLYNKKISITTIVTKRSTSTISAVDDLGQKEYHLKRLRSPVKNKSLLGWVFDGNIRRDHIIKKKNFGNDKLDGRDKGKGNIKCNWFY